MSTYNLPLVINGKLYKSTDLAELSYVSGFPSIMAALDTLPFDSLTSTCHSPSGFNPDGSGFPAKPYTYVHKGLQNFYCEPGKAFFWGGEISIYNKNATAGTETIMNGLIRSYDPVTGKLVARINSVVYGLDTGTVEANKIPSNLTQITCMSSRYVEPSTLSVAGGGSAVGSPELLKASLGADNMATRTIYFHDFLSNAEGRAVLLSTGLMGGLNPYEPIAVASPENHPGIASVPPMSGADNCALFVTPQIFPLGYSGVGGLRVTPNMSVETLIHIPTLFNSRNDYFLYIGLIAGGFVGGNRGVWFKYDGASSTSWKAGGYFTSSIENTSASLVATKWTKLRIDFDGTDFKYYVNSSLINTITADSLGYSLTGINSDMLFSLYVEHSGVSPSPIIALDYLSIDKAYASPRK